MIQALCKNDKNRFSCRDIMLVDNGIGIYKTDKNSIPKIIELRMVYILYVVAYG